MARPSLASKAKSEALVPVESNPGTGLPVGYSGGGVTAASPIYSPTPYVLFVSTKGQTFATVARHIPDLQEGDPVLIRGENVKPVKLNPLRFHLIQAFQHFSVVDSMGQVTKTIFDVEQAREDKTQKWSEHVETVVLACLGDGSVCPARCTFKTTKTNAVHTAIAALQQAENMEEWAKQSPEHRASAAAPQPWARFTATVTLKRGTARASGFNFVAANAFITPTGLADWQTLAAAFQDAEFKKVADAVYRRHQERVAEIKARSA